MGKTLGKNNSIYVHKTGTSRKGEQVSFVLPKSDMLEMRTVGNKDHESSLCAAVSVLKSYSMRGTRGAVRLCSVTENKSLKWTCCTTAFKIDARTVN